jgi:hypothetical protein
LLFGVKILLLSVRALQVQRQLATNDRAQCEYTDAALGIGITFAVLGLIIAIIAVNTKEQEEQTTY